MNINDQLYVEIVPMEKGRIPHPHPVDEGKFDPSYIYKVLGMYNPSETSECYFVLANPDREIWFIPQRHLRAFGILNSKELFLSRNRAEELVTSDEKEMLLKPPIGQQGQMRFALRTAEARSHGIDRSHDREFVSPDRLTNGAKPPPVDAPVDRWVDYP